MVRNAQAEFGLDEQDMKKNMGVHAFNLGKCIKLGGQFVLFVSVAPADVL